MSANTAKKWKRHREQKRREAFEDAYRWIFEDGEGAIPFEEACELAGVGIYLVRTEAERRIEGERRDLRQHIKGRIPARRHFGLSVIRRALRDLQYDVEMCHAPTSGKSY